MRSTAGRAEQPALFSPIRQSFLAQSIDPRSRPGVSKAAKYQLVQPFRSSSVVPAMDSPSRWIYLSIVVGAAFFIFALGLSAVFEPRIRILHALQALIYIAVVVVARRNSSWGYGAGFAISTFWNYINLFVTTFIRAGVQQLIGFFETGRITRPDLALSLIAAAGHFLLIFACLAGFLRNGPKAREWAQFVGGGVLAIAYFTLIIFAAGPQYIPLLRRVVGL
jgi:hypothetical protein